MKRAAVWMLAGMMCAWGARAVRPGGVRADGRWMETLAERGVAAPLEWEYVGRIVDGDGMPVAGAATLTVRLYGAPEAGDVLWARKVPALLDADGNFSVRLSDALEAPEGAPETALDTVLCGQACWIECQIDGHPGAMSPRAAVLASPYALFADGATGSREDFDVPGSLTVAGESRANSLSARDVEVSGRLEVSGTVTVGGNVSAAGGLKAGSLSGLGPVPVGTIILWHGETNVMPVGWAVCDGSTNNGVVTPNLSGRFPVGAGKNYSAGEVGGEATVALTRDEMPSHTHGYQTPRSDNTDEPTAAANKDKGVWSGNSKAQSSSVGGSEGSGDKGDPHENLPPYKALWYIIRVE